MLKHCRWVDYRGKGPQTLGPLDFEYLKGFHCDARCRGPSQEQVEETSEEENDREAQLATEQASAGSVGANDACGVRQKTVEEYRRGAHGARRNGADHLNTDASS
jgi:hypothetical protein